MDLFGELGMILDNGRLILTTASGGSLTTSPVTVKLPDADNPGRVVSRTLGGTYELHDSNNPTDSDLTGMEFGLTSGVAYAVDRPFMHGITYIGDTAYIVTTPNPTIRTMPAASNIGYKDNPASGNDDIDVVVWTTDNLGSQLTGQPVVPFATCTGQMDSSDDWAFDLTVPEGIGTRTMEYNFGLRKYQMAEGQRGAASGSYFMANGGTAPTYTSVQEMFFEPRLSGMCRVILACFNATGGTAGAGTGTLQAPLPYAGRDEGFTLGYWGNFGGYASETTLLDQFTWCTMDTGGNTRMQWNINTTLVTGQRLLVLNDQSAADRSISGQLIFQAFNG